MLYQVEQIQSVLILRNRFTLAKDYLSSFSSDYLYELIMESNTDMVYVI